MTAFFVAPTESGVHSCESRQKNEYKAHENELTFKKEKFFYNLENRKHRNDVSLLFYSSLDFLIVYSVI
jgi:hypothetical protein